MCSCLSKEYQLHCFLGEHVYELAMYLDLLNSSCFPTWPQVFAIAEQVMMTLSLSDPDLYTHLKSIAKTNMQVNKKVCKIVWKEQVLISFLDSLFEVKWDW